MESWTKLARIVKVTKNLDFVVDLATKSFFNSECLCELVGCKLCLVPPIIDACRNFIVTEVRLQQKNAIVKFNKVLEIEDEHFDLSQFKGKYLLIKYSDAKNIFKDVSCLDLNIDRLVGMKVYDKTQGFVGSVVDIGGTEIQLHLIVKGDSGAEFYIPYVEDIIEKIDNDIYVKMPDGLTNINNDD